MFAIETSVVTVPSVVGVKVTSKVVVSPGNIIEEGWLLTTNWLLPLSATIGLPENSNVSEPVLVIWYVWVTEPVLVITAPILVKLFEAGVKSLFAMLTLFPKTSISGSEPAPCNVTLVVAEQEVSLNETSKVDVLEPLTLGANSISTKVESPVGMVEEGAVITVKSVESPPVMLALVTVTSKVRSFFT